MLRFFVFEEIHSTQDYALTLLKSEHPPKLPICVMANSQTQGRGSRGNAWDRVERALLFSFAFKKKDLPKDLPIQSLSLYLGEVMEEFLLDKGSKSIWLKWPNDLYIREKKIGGILTQCVGENCICGIGINLESQTYAQLDLHILETQKQPFVQEFLEFLFSFPTWKEIFSKYKLKFHKNFSYYFHHHNQKISFRDAVLCEDGAIMIDNQKIYSLR
ncbi:biotin--[acetyl-CoA-carboxylase] ligase [Helicobacter cholecystus]|uniref:biotin--[acetyl-CoA-carboxylase] ligase n=1 Tax=Helicobacter cholecystus TaxID=45498 RepID=UPI000F6D1C72|nr:biotin--[acetyl-CoA-carboxylase] ligase [Helicobacter cholecystus]VEJ26189.1 biotin-protein ligase [Helicobacter cholecystus]